MRATKSGKWAKKGKKFVFSSQFLVMMCARGVWKGCVFVHVVGQ